MNLDYKDLYLANNIEALKIIAKNKIIIPNSFEKKCRALDRLYDNAKSYFLYDQERSYVLFYRFNLTFERYSSLRIDSDFMQVRFGTQREKCRSYLELLEKDLNRRYAERQQGEEAATTIGTPTVSLQKKNFPEHSMTCHELYSALADKSNNILLVDARPEEDFKQSRITMGQIINVPDHIIQSGLSAHCIGNDLPPEYQAIWDKRETFDLIVLIDWNSTLDTMASTKLEKLLSALVDWDTNKVYVQKPIILNGGYSEWGEHYPSFCTNPHIVMNRMNMELDDILNIDNIVYPTEVNKAASIIPFQGSKSLEMLPPEDDDTREQLIRKNKDLSMQSTQIYTELLAQEETLSSLSAEETNAEQVEELLRKIEYLQNQLDTLNEEKTKAQDQFDLYAGFDPQNEKLEAKEIKEIAEMDKSNEEKLLIFQTMAKQHLEALAKARESKPISGGEPSNTSLYPSPGSLISLKGGKTEKPFVNRATKPIVHRPRIIDDRVSFNPEGSGLVGLRNISNTCYMNTVVQCMRTIPSLVTLFCTGQYRSHVKQKPGAIIMETAYLFRSLWSNFYKSLNPDNFYDRVCSIDPNYGMGNHEDCMEFFLFLLNILHEDCAYDIQKPEVMSPIQHAWFSQLGGKMSIFTEIFYHQLRITQYCKNCDIKTYKFEIESTIMLPVTENDFKIEDLMRNYMKDYIIEDYHCSKCRKPVTNTKSVSIAPSILVIVLKRYKQIMKNNNATLSKIDSKAAFPISGLIFGKERYKLNSIAMHSGTLTSGHYTAACCVNSKWYEFNDEVVKPINIDEDYIKIKACAFFYYKE